MTTGRQDPAADPPGFTLDSTRDEVLAALHAADPAAHAHAERGEWDQLDHHGPLGEQALAWARFHRQLPAQRRHVERLELESALRGLGLERELESAYLAQLAAVEDSEGAMRAVFDEARARKLAADRAQASLMPELSPVAASAGLVHFAVERQELVRALMAVQSVRDGEATDLGKIQVACHATVILRAGTAGAGPQQSFFELRLLTTRCLRAGDVTVQGQALRDALRNFNNGPIEIMKAEGHNVLKLRQRALETNVPSVDYVPIDPAVDGMTSAGVLALEHLRSMLDTVVYVAKSAQGSDERLARIRLVFEDGRLHIVATDGAQLVRAVRDLPGGEALHGFQLSARDAERLGKLLRGYALHLHPSGDSASVLLRLSVRPGHVLAGESDALRFAFTHDAHDFPAYHHAIPKATPDILLVARSDLREHLYAARRVFTGDTSPRVELLACGDDVRLRAHDPATGALTEGTFKDALAHARPFSRALNPTYLIDALDHLPNTMHYALACDARRLETPLLILPWPSPAGRGRERVKEVVALGLKSGTFALVMPLRPDKEIDHGCTP